MDIGTLIGLGCTFGLPILAIVLAGNPAGYIDPPSVLIVAGGSLGVTLASIPLVQITPFGSILSKSLFPAQDQDPLKTVETLVEFSERARREGILALENAIIDIEDEFLKSGIRLAVDGVEPELIKEIMETELNFLEDRHKKGANIFDILASSAPAFGMIGTLIGLVGMLQNLSDPSAIGPPMATALLTTLYGSYMAFAFATPISNKLKARSGEEILIREMTIEGIMAIQSGDNPRIVQQRLVAYLAPSIRPQSEDV